MIRRLSDSEKSSPRRKVAAPSKSDELRVIEESIRPSTFNEIIGRRQEKESLMVMINAAKSRGESVDHVLFYGPPGLGKTTFAMAIAKEIGSGIKVTSGPAIERAGDLAAILTNLERNDLLFIDEIHRLSRNIEEILYPAMEDGVLDIVMGKGSAAKSIRLNLEPFTLVGATTQIGRVSAPLRDRFGLIQRLDYFEEGDLVEIVRRAAKIAGITFEEDALYEVAKRSRGTGRVALRLFKRVRDFYQHKNSNRNISPTTDVTKDLAVEALEILKIDQLGLEDIDRKLLSTIMDSFDGGPVGLSTLAASISEDSVTLAEVYEPFLLKLGLIKRGPRGRILTQKGIGYINDKDPRVDPVKSEGFAPK